MKSIFIALYFFILLPGLQQRKSPPPPRGLVYIFAGGGTAGMDLNAGFGAEVRVANGLGAAAEVGGIAWGQEDNKETGLASLNLTYHYFQKKPLTKVAPFISGGLSDFFGHNTRTRIGSVGPYHTIGFNAGGGIDVFATRHVGVRFDVRYSATAGVFSIGSTRTCSNSVL